MRGPILLLLMLAACGETPGDPAALNQFAGSDGHGTIPCAKGGTSPSAGRCVVERNEGPNGTVLTVRHPDGAFRRLLVTKDGRGVATADGAEPAKVRIVGADRIEVSVADDRYELPATIKGGGQR